MSRPTSRSPAGEPVEAGAGQRNADARTALLWAPDKSSGKKPTHADDAGSLRPRSRHHGSMDHDQDRIAEMFARITALAEDAAALAVEGQGVRTSEDALKVAQALAHMGDQISVLSRAIMGSVNGG